MIVLSVGLPKAGSAWFFMMTNELLKAAGLDDALEIRNRYKLEDILKFKTCNIQEPTPQKLALLTSPPISDHTFVVKTHFPPNPGLLELISKKRIKSTFIYRDPRDMAVSAFDAGVKLREKGKETNFAKLTTMEKAIHFVDNWLQKSWVTWSKVPGIFKISYESLLDLNRALPELQRLSTFLGFDLADSVLIEIHQKWQGQQAQNKGTPPMHFNKGVSGRYRTTMSRKELALCKKRLGPYLTEMGYAN